MRKLAVILAVLALPAAAQAAAHKPTCRAGYAAQHVRVPERHWVHGHHWLVRHDGKVVFVRVWRCEKVAAKPTSKPPIVITTSAPAPTSPAPSSPAPASPQPTAANLDPSYTQDPANPLKVTWSYSASDAGAPKTPPPLGSLTLTVSQTGQAGFSGNCSTEVGGANPSTATCTLALPQYGSWDVTVSYTGADPSSTAPATQTETEQIEPPPATVQEAWGSTPPTAGPTVSANVVGSTASVTVTDQDFEGAASLGVTDNLGDKCSATVSGTTATCNMPVSGIPSTFTLAYPGGTTQTSTRPVAPNGVQQVSYVWGADSAPVSSQNTTVTSQQAPVTWNGCFVNGHACGSPMPDPLAANTGQAVNLFAYAAGSLGSDQNPQGWITFTVQAPNGASYTASNEQSGGASTADCSVSQNYSTQAVGGCSYDFQTVGTYYVTPSFHSSDANYPNGTGPTEVVNVS